MKNLNLNTWLLILFIVTLIGCTKEDVIINTEAVEAEELREQRILFEESVVLLINTDSILAERKVETVELVSFNNDYNKLTSYDLRGKTFSDTGEGFDAVKGDGIYTAQEISNQDNVLESKLAKNEQFQYKERLDALLETRKLKLKLKVSCRLTSKKEGTTVFGFSCEKWGGCVEVSDCKIEVEIES